MPPTNGCVVRMHEWGSEALQAVFDHYDLRWPNGSTGQRTVKCPVHDDAHASATVNMEKGLFHCFACGAGGSAADLVMAREGLEYVGAVRYIEEVVGFSDSGVRTGVRRKPSRGVHGKARGQRRKYVPSWLRNA